MRVKLGAAEDKRAVEVFQLAADNVNALAQTKLALMYDGKGVAQDSWGGDAVTVVRMRA